MYKNKYIFIINKNKNIINSNIVIINIICIFIYNIDFRFIFRILNYCEPC